MARREKPSFIRKIGKGIEQAVFRGCWARNLSRCAGLQPKPALKTISYDAGLGKRGQESLTVAFVSDIHAGKMTHPDLIREMGRVLGEIRCDLLLVGGDYIFLEDEEMGLVVESLSAVSPPFGKFGVLGNHDRWIGRGSLRDRLESAGVRILVNEEARFSKGGSGHLLYGLDDVEWGDPSFKGLSPGTGTGVALLLSHSPEALSLEGCAGFDFAFFGHTHAGQIAPPFGRPLLPFKDRYSKQFPYGFYDIGEENGFLPMYVTSGIGCVWLPARVFARPEVVLVTFL